MLMRLTLAVCAGSLLAGCIIDTSKDDTSSTGTTTPGGTTVDDPTTGGTTVGTTGGTTGPTTSSEPTTGGEFSACGWYAEESYYACAPDGVPGLEDPMGLAPIACPDELPAMDDPCEDDGPVSNLGCCNPDGTLYYCSSEQKIFIEDCDG
jgi:hypothetical protein